MKGELLLSRLPPRGNKVEAEAFDRCACIFQLLRVPTLPYTASAPDWKCPVILCLVMFDLLCRETNELFIYFCTRLITLVSDN